MNPLTVKNSLLYSTFILAAGIFGGSVSAQGAAIAFAEQYTNLSGSLAPGSAEDFAFYGYGAVNSTSTYAVSTHFTVTPLTGGNTNIAHFGFATPTANVIAPNAVGPFSTGFLYNNAGSGGSLANLLTFTSDAAAFTVYILDSNVDAAFNHNASISLFVGAGTPVTRTTVQTANSLEWTAFSVTGAIPSDVFTVRVTSDNTSAYKSIGGITFSVVPEPSTWGMLMGGLGMLAFVQRARRRLPR